MPSPAIQIVTIKPKGYAHSETFAELAETLHDAFLDLGTSTQVVEDCFDPTAVNLVLGWHLLTEAQEAALPPQCILYNLEQMDERNRPFQDRLVRLSERCEIWDYSRRNIEILHRGGFSGSVQHVPIGTMPGLTRIPVAPDQDIDVLFYGSINERRRQVLQGLKDTGLRVHTAFGVYGRERDALIARAKVVLNLHYYETSILEMVRLSYLWANRKAVVTECSPDTDLETGLEGAARFVPYDRLVAACRELVTDEATRHTLEIRAFEVMSARSEAVILRKVLAGEAEVLPSRPGDSGSVHPLCSLVIPVFNKVEYTRQCVEKLREGTPEGRYELIFIDNASTDATAEFLAGLQGRVKVITNAENRGFVDACNQGAAEAEGRYLVFLNNDTAPLPGWLGALAAMFEADPSVGAAGARLVYPDGRLQEAGGLVFRDGSGWNFGRFGDPLDPAFNTPAEVDYCSGAALMVRRELFERLGGFDRRYAPAYYEDTDLCFGLRSLGYKVMYCPTSTVIHFEGITAGTDLTTGFKRYQAINREKFVAKWAEALAKQDPPPTETGHPPTTADRRRLEPQPAPSSTPAPHVLIVDPFLPLHDRASGSLRLFRIILILRAMKCDVTYIARDGRGQDSYQRQLESFGVKVYATDPEKMAQLGQACNAPTIDLAQILADHPCQVAWLSFYDIAEQYLPDIRRISPGTTVVVDTVDVHFLREIRQAELAGDAGARQRAAVTRERELRIYAQADRVVTVTEADAEVLRDAGLSVPTIVVPNIHPPVGETPGWEARNGLVFVGNFNHTPNVDAALWFCREILPRVQAQLPDARLTIIGPNPPAEVQALGSTAVSVLGWVPDTAPHLDAARISVAPLRVGAGMKVKVGEALSRGLPVVTTSIGAEGMELQDGHQAMIADDPTHFAEAVARLYKDRPFWEQLAQAGKASMKANYSIKPVIRLFQALLLPGASSRPTHQWQGLVAEVHQALSIGDHAAVELGCQRLDLINATALEPTFFRAVARLQRGEVQSALGLLEMLRDKSPNNPAVLSALGDARVAAGLWDGAMEACRAAISAAPTTWAIYEKLAKTGRSQYSVAQGLPAGAGYCSAEDVAADVARAVERDDLDYALSALATFVRGVLALQRGPQGSISDIAYGHVLLDLACVAIGRRALQDSSGTNSQGWEARSVYIASQLYLTGGHTRVLQDFIRADPSREAVVLMTEFFPEQDRASIEGMFPSTRFEWAPAVPLSGKLRWLVSRLRSLTPDRLFLFSHHEDSVAVSAALPELARSVYFVHHADFELSLGPFLPDVAHIDLSNVDHYTCTMGLGIHSIYVPLSAMDRGLNRTPLRNDNGTIVTCSSGSGNKFFRPGYRFRYLDLFPWLFQQGVSRHIHIGGLPDPFLAQIYERLDRGGIDRSRLVYSPFESSYWLALEQKGADVCLGSFPLGGGRTCVEAMGSGTPYVSHRNYLQRNLTETDMLYSSAHVWHGFDELGEALANLTGPDRAAQAEEARAHFDRYHRFDQLVEALADVRGTIAGLVPAPVRPFRRDALQATIDRLFEASLGGP